MTSPVRPHSAEDSERFQRLERILRSRHVTPRATIAPWCHVYNFTIDDLDELDFRIKLDPTQSSLETPRAPDYLPLPDEDPATVYFESILKDLEIYATRLGVKWADIGILRDNYTKKPVVFVSLRKNVDRRRNVACASAIERRFYKKGILEDFRIIAPNDFRSLST